jgi:hypothetical protein
MMKAIGGVNLKIRVNYRRSAAILLACALAFQLTGCAAPNRLSPVASSRPSSQTVTGEDSDAPSSGSSSSVTSSAASAVSSAAEARGQTEPDQKEESAPLKKIPETKASQMVERRSVQKCAAAAKGYSAVTQDSGYRSLLTDTERTLYQLIDSSVYQVAVSKTYRNYAPTGQISIPGKLTEAQIRLTTTAYLDDHPQVFWTANAYSYGYRNNQTILQLYSELTQSECNTAAFAFRGKVQSIVQSIPSGLSEFDREKYLFHYIANICTYDDAAVKASDGWKSYTAYGALMDGKAVCEGYSRAMLLLCGYAGLPGVLVRGSDGNVAHMWNEIKIDENWYHLDLTWCDSSRLVYNYYNIDDKTIQLTHQIAPVFTSLTDAQICGNDSVYNLARPICSSMAANYFYKKGIVISTLDDSGDSAVVSAIAACLQERKTTLAFRINANDYDAVIRGLTSASPYKMAAYLEKAAKAAGVSLDRKGLSYSTDKSDSGLNVFVSYQ